MISDSAGFQKPENESASNINKVRQKIYMIHLIPLVHTVYWCSFVFFLYILYAELETLFVIQRFHFAEAHMASK